MSAKWIKDQTKCGWSVKINGKVIDDVAHLELFNPRFGTLTYGDVGGYDSWNFHENGGGASIIVPYVIFRGYLFVLMIEQDRPNQGGRVWNLPRGFLDPGEIHRGAAIRELEEETSIRSTKLIRLGSPVNPNSAFFVTSGEGEGAHFYRLKVEESQVKSEHESVDGLIKGPLIFSEGIIRPIPKTAERIFGRKFFRYEEALAVGDMYTVAAVGRLVHLWVTKRL